MKNFKLKAMLLAVLLCSSVSAFADIRVSQDGIVYGLRDDLTAYVSSAENDITTANIPEKITHEGKDYTVTGIGDRAFWSCTGLASVDIPSSVTSIDDNAFYGCSSLFAYHYKKDGTATLLKVGYKSAEISGKDTYNIPEKVTHEGKDYSVTGIGGRAFEGCTGLASVDIPGSVTSIGYGAFWDCSRLFAYHYKKDGTATLLKAGYNSAEMSGRETYSIPEKVTHNGTEYSVTRIGEYAFYDCTGLASVVIPNSVTSIGDYAFYKCTGLTSVNIPNSVTSIGEGTFFICSSLASVDIPSSVTSIGDFAFSYCSSLASVDIPGSVTIMGDHAFLGCSSLFAYHYKKDGTATLLKVGYKSAEISGKDTYNIPEKVTHEGKDYSVTGIGGRAFEGCTGLASLDIPNSVTSIGGGAFYGCSGLASVVIPSSVTSIGESTFYFCSSLASVDIPSSVTSIGDYAFNGCTGLASVDIPGSVTSIGQYAFRNCTGLASVVIPNSVTSIGDYAFNDCTGLASVDIPNSVTSIGYYAFSGCTGLKKLVCNATTPPVCQRGVFIGVDKNECTLYVPQESLDAYKSAARWKDFFNITTGIKDAVKTSSATEEARYSADGTRLVSPQKGINIIRMSDGTVKKVLVK